MYECTCHPEKENAWSVIEPLIIIHFEFLNLACLGASLSLSLFSKLWGIRNLNEMWEREGELSCEKALVSGPSCPGVGRELHLRVETKE